MELGASPPGNLNSDGTQPADLRPHFAPILFFLCGRCSPPSATKSDSDAAAHSRLPAPPRFAAYLTSWRRLWRRRCCISAPTARFRVHARKQDGHERTWLPGFTDRALPNLLIYYARQTIRRRPRSQAAGYAPRSATSPHRLRTPGFTGIEGAGRKLVALQQLRESSRGVQIVNCDR